MWARISSESRLSGGLLPAIDQEDPLTSESFSYDGLGRLTRAQSGNVVSEFAFDSMGRLLSDKTNGRTTTFGRDDVGNATQVGYPSGPAVARTFDALNLPQTISSAAMSASPLATYGYRGSGLVAKKELGNGLVGRHEHDLAGRLVSQAFKDPQNRTVFQESVSWSPRGLKVALSRGDLNSAGFLMRYDAAGRLLEAARSTSPVNRPNNQTVEAIALSQLPDAFSFSYDAAQNLLGRRPRKSGVSVEELMPVDALGRNRPSSVNGKLLEWDAAGNLVRKGDLRLHYDYNNRLVRVTNQADEEVARYGYDAFNRRITKTVSGETRETVWNGWQAIEEYKDGQLAQRRVHGAGLDEIVRQETDLDGNGLVEAAHVPLYDDTGNLVAATGLDGKPIERYLYSPYGEQTILVDSTPPEVEQVRVEAGAVWIEVSEEISGEALAAAVAAGTFRLADVAAEEDLAVEVTLPVQTGRQARRRLVVTTTDPPPAAATQLKLTIPPQALQDFFLNRPQQPYELTFAWPAADTVLFDETPIKLDLVVIREGILEIGFTEEPDAATLSAIQLSGAPATWTLSDDRYSLTAQSPLAAGSYTLSLGTALEDLNGNALAQAYDTTLTLANQDSKLVFEAPDPRKTPTSTIANPYGFQGLPKDPETGFLYVRNRYYDPELGRFITVDPLGYVDGPNVYGFAMNDPVNGSDPLGLCLGTGCSDLGSMHPGPEPPPARQQEPGSTSSPCRWWNPLAWADCFWPEEKAPPRRPLDRSKLKPIYVKVDPIISSSAWTEAEVEAQLKEANRVFTTQANVHIVWDAVRKDPQPKEALTFAATGKVVDTAAENFATDEAQSRGVPILFVRETMGDRSSGGMSRSPENPVDRRRASVVNRHWLADYSLLTATHELGHSIGGLCDPVDFNPGCRMGAPNPDYGGVMNYPSPDPAIKIQGDSLTDAEVMRLRKNAKAVEAGPPGKARQ